MTKKEFAEKLSEKIAVSKKDSETIFEAMIDLLRETIVQKGHYSISGFGTFKLKERKARTGRNPRTGEAVKVKASRSITFKASHVLKDSLK